MTAIYHRVTRAQCRTEREHCASIHSDEGPDPFQPFHALATIAGALYPDEWTTREGVTIKIRDMATSHIENTLRWIKRNEAAYVAKYKTSWLAVPYPMFNGDMAQQCAENEYEQLVDSMMNAKTMDDMTIVKALRAELARRAESAKHARSAMPFQPASW